MNFLGDQSIKLSNIVGESKEYEEMRDQIKQFHTELNPQKKQKNRKS